LEDKQGLTEEIGVVQNDEAIDVSKARALRFQGLGKAETAEKGDRWKLYLFFQGCTSAVEC
jgi:hypothetical protein